MGKTKAKGRRRYLGPESNAYKSYEGLAVRITFTLDAPEDSMVCRLLWVDQYTVGVKQIPSGRERMLYKQHIFTIELETEEAKLSGETRKEH